MRHLGAIAGRELGAYFRSPVAYGVLVLFSLLSGFFFVAQVVQFDGLVQSIPFYEQFYQQPDFGEQINLNDNFIAEYLGVHWILLLFLVPGLTMNLFAGERQHHTDELLLTSPLSILEIVLGKYLATALMVTLLGAVVALLTGITFWFGNPPPEFAKTAAGLLGLWLLALSYAAFGTFTSALTRSPILAFLLCFLVLLMLALASFFAAGAGEGGGGALLALLRWLSTEHHFGQMRQGLLSTTALAHFVFFIAASLLLAKTAVESVRWRQ